MKKPPLTLEQAGVLAYQYQSLVGRPLCDTKDWLIDCVAIAPADPLNQWLFAHLYMDTGCIVQAGHFYHHNTFDVLLISVYDRSREGVAFKDLRSYLEAAGEAYSLADDAAARYADAQF